MIRTVQPDEVNYCIQLAQEVMQDTPYAGCTISKKKIRDLMPLIFSRPEEWFFKVSERKGRIDGFVIGMIAPLFFSTKDWYVTDLVFVVRPGSYCGFALMQNFKAWYQRQAKRCPGRFIPLLGNSSGHKTVDAFYKRQALEPIGAMFSEMVQ